MLKLIPVVTLCGALVGSAQEKAPSYKIPYAELRKASSAFLEAHLAKEEIQALGENLDKRVAQKLEDNSSLQEDAAICAIVLDWLTDNRKRFRNREAETIAQACFYFIYFTDKRYKLPWQFREQLDEKTCNEILGYMKEPKKVASSAESKAQAELVESDDVRYTKIEVKVSTQQE